MVFTIDKRIYNDNVISKVVYWLSGDYSIVRKTIDEYSEQVEINAINKDIKDGSVEVRITQLLNDFKLRQIVADETRDIKTILYAKAFAEDEELCEGDIHD